MKDCTCPEPRATSWSLSCELHGQSRIRALEARVEMVYKAREADAAHIKGLSDRLAALEARLYADDKTVAECLLGLKASAARSPSLRRTPRRSR